MAVFTMAAALAGCSQPTLKQVAPTLDALFGFEALLEARDTKEIIPLVLDGPREVVDWDGTSIPAYRLAFGPSSLESTKTNKEWFLDGSLRVIARRTICDDAIVDCGKTTIWSWEERGDLAPFGVGYTSVLESEGHLTSFIGRTQWEIPFVLDVDAQGATLHTSFPYSFPASNSRNGTLEYAPLALVPTGPKFVVKEYVESSASLPEIPLVDFGVPRAQVQPWRGPFFPEAEGDHFAIGTSHAAIIEKSEPRFSETAEISDLCLVVYNIQAGFPTDSSPGAVLSRQQTAYGMILVLSGGLVREYQFSVFRDGLGNVDIEPRLGATVPSKLTCDELRRTPWPLVGVSAALAEARTVGVSGTGPMGLAVTLAQQRSYGRLPENGWHQYVVYFKPNHVEGGRFYDAYEVRLDPWLNRLEEVHAAPTDAISFSP